MLIHQILVSPLEDNSQILLKGEYQIASVSHDYNLKHKQIWIVGRVVEVKREGACISFWIDDGSGRIKAKQWTFFDMIDLSLQ